MPRIGRQEAPPAAQEVLRAGLLGGYSVDNEGTVAVHSPYSRGPLAATMKAGPGRARVHRKEGPSTQPMSSQPPLEELVQVMSANGRLLIQ